MMWFMRSVLGIELPEDVTTFRSHRRRTARLIAGLPEKKKFFSALAVWTGARSASVPVGHAARVHGVTKYNLGKLINHTFDLMVGFSTRPLRLIGTLGGVVALFGLGFGLFRIAQKLLGADITMGYTSLFSAVVILGGLQLIALSVIGEYIGRIFIQAQGRPLYNVAEEIGFAATVFQRRRVRPSEGRALSGDERARFSSWGAAFRSSVFSALHASSGSHVIGVDANPSAIGAAVCQEFHEASTHDVEAIVRVARQSGAAASPPAARSSRWPARCGPPRAWACRFTATSRRSTAAKPKI